MLNCLQEKSQKGRIARKGNERLDQLSQLHIFVEAMLLCWQSSTTCQAKEKQTTAHGVCRYEWSDSVWRNVYWRESTDGANDHGSDTSYSQMEESAVTRGYERLMEYVLNLDSMDDGIKEVHLPALLVRNTSLVNMLQTHLPATLVPDSQTPGHRVTWQLSRKSDRAPVYSLRLWCSGDAVSSAKALTRLVHVILLFLSHDARYSRRERGHKDEEDCDDVSKHGNAVQALTIPF